MERAAGFEVVESGWASNPTLYAAAAMICLLLESLAPFDAFFQRPFFHNGLWIISRAFHASWKNLLYTGPKVLIGVIGGVFLLVFAFSFIRGKTFAVPPAWRRPALLVALSIALVPLCVAALKAVTGVYSPVDLEPYGGRFPHLGLLEQLWLHGQPSGGRSFPAGHASGGFALMSLYYLPLSRAWKKRLFFMGLLAGWLMGLYQMGRGEHFISHTLTTMLIALALISLLARKFRIQ